MMFNFERTSIYQYTQHSDSEEERLAKLKKILNSLATRIPVVLLRRVEEVYPNLNVNVRTDDSAHSSAPMSKAAYGNGGYKHVERSCDFNVHEESEPENLAEECKVVDKCQNMRSELAEYDSDKCDNTGTGLTRYKHSERYPCKLCNKSLRGSYMALHMMMHMGTLAHICQFCAKQFPYKSNLKVHYRRVHGIE